jgi:hypothetical protein
MEKVNLRLKIIVTTAHKTNNILKFIIIYLSAPNHDAYMMRRYCSTNRRPMIYPYHH